MGKFLLVLVLFVNIALAGEPGGVITDPDDPKPVDISKDSTDALTVFSARIKDKTIYINWRIVNIKDISYFELYKMNSRSKEYEKMEDGKIKQDDYFEKTETSPGVTLYKFDFEDKPERDGVYYYKLKAYNAAGQKLFESDEIKIGVTGIRNFKLDQNNPNPFNPTTIIKYELFEASFVKLKVFDLIGKEIATLVESNQAPGTYSIEFDASKYSSLTSGIYFYKLETEVSTEVREMILTK